MKAVGSIIMTPSKIPYFCSNEGNAMHCVELSQKFNSRW